MGRAGTPRSSTASPSPGGGAGEETDDDSGEEGEYVPNSGEIIDQRNQVQIQEAKKYKILNE